MVKKSLRTKKPWISDTTWKLADQRMALRSNFMENQQERRTATRRFHLALRKESRYRVRKVGEEIKELVVNDQLREVWNKIQRWYQEYKGH